MVHRLSHPGSLPHIILEQHHQYAYRYSVLLDVTDDGAVWSWLFQSVTEEEGLPLAKVSSPVFPQGTNVAFWDSFQSNSDEIQTVYSVWRIEHNTKTKFIFLMSTACIWK